MPPAAQRFDQLHAGDLALSGKLRVGALSLQRFAARVHDLEVADDARSIPFRSQFGGSLRILHRPLLRLGLVGQMPDRRQTVFHVSESNENSLAITRDALLKRGLRAL